MYPQRLEQPVNGCVSLAGARRGYTQFAYLVLPVRENGQVQRQTLGGARSCPAVAIKTAKKGTFPSPKVPQTSGPKGASHPLRPQVTPLTVPRARGKQTPSSQGSGVTAVQQHTLAFTLLASSSRSEVLLRQGILSPTWQPLKQRQGHQELSSTVPNSSGPCQSNLSSHLRAPPTPNAAGLASASRQSR